MMYRVGHIIMFIIVIISKLSSFTFAPFVLNPPDTNTSRTCDGWIIQHGLENDLSLNVQWALSLPILNMRQISLWAVGYAYELYRDEYNEALHTHTPIGFCNKHVPYNAYFTYMALEDAEFTCQGWIHFNGHDHRIDHQSNLLWARSRNINLDPHISIWAAGYFQYITSHPSRSNLTSAEFCRQMNQPVVNLPSEFPFMRLNGEKMTCEAPYLFLGYYNHERLVENALPRLKFMTQIDTNLSCKAWIALYGYGDGIKDNVYTLNKQAPNFNHFFDFIAVCAKNYLTYLQHAVDPEHYKSVPMTASKFCERSGHLRTDVLNYNCEPLNQQ